MTNHSIDELTRQYDQANQRKIEADRDYQFAATTLKRALIERAGYFDKIVITKAIPRGVLVQDATMLNGKVFNFTGPAIKADGTAGSTNRIIYRYDKIIEVREARP